MPDMAFAHRLNPRRDCVINVRSAINASIPTKLMSSNQSALNRRRSPIPIREILFKRGDESGGIVGVEITRGVAAHFGQARILRHHHRDAARHRLDRRKPEALID